MKWIRKVLLFLLSTLFLFANTPKVDIIFVLDTSGSMDDEATSLQKAINNIKNSLINNQNFDANIKVLGIYPEYDYTCNVCQGTVKEVIEQEGNISSIDQYEDWGPAIIDLATKYTGWRNDAVKVIVPISDECPQDGDWCDKADDDIAQQAATIAQQNNVYVIPVVGNGASSDVEKLAQVVAGPNGQVFTTSNTFTSEDMEKAIKSIIGETVGNYVYLNDWKVENVVNNAIDVKIISAPGSKYYELNITDENNNQIIHTSFNTSSYLVSIPSNSNINLNVSLRAIGEDSNGKPIYTPWQAKTVNFNPITPDNIDNIVLNPSTSQYQVVKKVVEAEKSPIETISVEENNLALSPQNIIKQSKQEQDPVDVTTGDFLYHNTDLVIPTLGVPLEITRFYSSVSNTWSFNLEPSIDLSDINNIIVYWPNGNKDILEKTDNGWISPYTQERLISKDGYFVIVKPSGIEYYFDTNGKIAKILDKKGNGITYFRTYDQNGLSLIVIKDTLGNTIAAVEKDNNGKIILIVDSKGNQIKYNWDGDKLTSYTDRNGNTFTYEYDSNGFMYKIIGPDGKAYVENEYDTNGRVLSQKDGSGNETKFEYEFLPNINTAKTTTVTYPDGTVKTYQNFLTMPEKISLNGVKLTYEYNGTLPTKIVDPNGKSITYKYNQNGLVTKQTDPVGNSYEYQYDSNNNLISVKDPNGEITTYTYDSNNNLIKITYPDGNSTKMEYNPQNQLTKIIDPLGNETKYTYNDRGFLSQITYPNGATTKYEYDKNGNLIKIIDPIGRTTTYTYDNNSRLVKITDPIGNTISYKYNAYGDLIEITDEQNRTTKMEYNVDGLLTKITLFDGRTFEKKYDAMGRVIEQIDDLNRSIKYDYDAFGRISKVTDPKGNEFNYIYDNVGNLIKVVDAKGNEIKTDYDELYRPSKFYDANGNVISETFYNKVSLPTQIKDATGKNLKFNYDSMNRLTSTTLSDTITAKAVYDALGRVKEMIDPKGYKISYEYDSMGNVIKETNPLGLSTSYEYDNVNRLTKIITPKGITYKFTYNDLDEVTNTFISGDNVSYELNTTYDKYGKLISLSDNEGNISYTYDKNNRITSRKDIFGNVVKYKYDKAGRISKLIYPNGKFITYEYDENDNLIKLTDVNSKTTTFEYDKNSLLTKITYPTGAYVKYTYDKNNRLISVKNYNSKGELLTDTVLTRNIAGDITDIKQTDYIKADYSKIPSLTFNYNEFNQITSTNEGEFTYDENGNLLKFPLLEHNNTFVYDLKDRLINATILNDSFSYKYDAEDNRVEITKNGTTTRYLVDNVLGLSKPIAKLDNNNTIQEYYIYAPNGLLYSTDDNGNIKIYFYDYKGNTNLVIDNKDKILAAYTYSVYGITLGKYETFKNPFRFLGKYGVMTDNDAQIYIRARYYNPYFARWNKPDTIRGSITSPLSLNRYAYNMGDGVNYVDVSGYFMEETINILLNGTKDNIIDLAQWLDKNVIDPYYFSSMRATGTWLAYKIKGQEASWLELYGQEYMRGQYEIESINTIVDTVQTVANFTDAVKDMSKIIKMRKNGNSVKQIITYLGNQTTGKPLDTNFGIGKISNVLWKAAPNMKMGTYSKTLFYLSKGKIKIKPALERKISGVRQGIADIKNILTNPSDIINSPSKIDESMNNIYFYKVIKTFVNNFTKRKTQ